MEDQRVQKYNHSGSSHKNIEVIRVNVVEEPKLCINRRPRDQNLFIQKQIEIKRYFKRR